MFSDVKEKDKGGNEYIIEMQLTDKIGFAKRVVYYSAKSYSLSIKCTEMTTINLSQPFL